ncbi:MAG: branched-chain amino acid ABC transporter permease/ATP-binding protein [Ilumatobacteraceae bacterium]
MDQYLVFTLIGLGFGCLYAAIAMGVIVTFRGTGVINFATGAIAMWGAYVFAELRSSGDLFFPVIGLPHRVHLADDLPFVVAFGLGVLSCALVGILCHLLVFRPLRNAPVLAKVVASTGVLLFLQAVVALQFGSSSRAIGAILPNQNVFIGKASFPRDRLWLTLVVMLVAVALIAYFRFTRFGLATRAAAENERAAQTARFAPSALAGATWVLSSVVVGAIGILVAPTTPLNPVTYVLAIVPALAATLIGRFQSIGVTVAAALVLGSFQSVVTFQTSKAWWPRWAVTGLSDAVPFLVIVLALFLLGDRLPTRGSAQADRLPPVVRPQNRPAVIVALVIAGAALILVTGGSYRFGVITSMILSIVTLSLVVLTGLVGQISLAQAALAGAAGFTLSKVTVGLSVPFPISILVSSLVAAAFGVLIGIPALRIRGAQLAVVTLAGGVALEKFVFRNPHFTAANGNRITNPILFGMNLGIRQGRDVARWQFGLVVLLVLAASALLVANLTRSATGRRFLAVRSNERAAASAGISVAATKLLAFGIASFLAGVGGSLIGYSRGQLSAESFTALVGMSLLAFAYLGGITSISGALVAGLLAPLGLGYVVMNRLFELGNTYNVIAGVGLILTAVMNPEGIAGATRQNIAALTRRRRRGGAEAPASAPGADMTTEPAPRRPRRIVEERPVVLDAEGISVHFGGVKANDGVSLQVRRGQIVGLIGPNGAGKTTFIDAITGFVPSSGQLTFDGHPLGGLAPHQRTRAGLVRTWQSVELFADLSVIENLRVASDTASASSVALDLVAPNRAADLDQVEWALSLMGLSHAADASPASLSLGQQKLVGVARALAARPKLVLLDEPAAGLDSGESRVLGDRLFDIVEHDISVFLVDHDMGLVLDVCDYIYVLDFGRIIAAGTPAEIRTDPAVITAYLGQEVTA